MASVKILLVEDDPALVEMYKVKFSEEGFEIMVANDGEAGLALAQQEIPSVMMLDIMMPKMDGFAVLAELKKDLKTKDIVVVLLSNLGQESDIEKGKQMGAADYVVKASMTPTQVFEKVKSYLTK